VNCGGSLIGAPRKQPIELEDEFECLLVNARHVKQVPGRKTDVGDAEWLCRLVEAGLLRANLVPPKPIRQLRNLTRYRKTQIQERSREVNRLHKALEDAGIKLDRVAADIMGKSGRDMLDALVAGERDPEVLANLARRQMRNKIPALREALEGRFEEHHALWIGTILAHVDFLDQQIERLTEAIGEQIAPLAPAVELLRTITGVQSRAAEVIISEIGGDMSRFPTPRHLASWAGQCPGNDQSAGKRRSGKTRNGSRWLDWTLEEIAIAAIRVKGTYLQAQYQRLRPRRGHKKALGAIKHTVIRAVWHMLSTGEVWRDLGGDYFTHRDPERRTNRLIHQLEQLGHTVTLTAAPAPQTKFSCQPKREARRGLRRSTFPSPHTRDGWATAWGLELAHVHKPEPFVAVIVGAVA
jgi:transposase